MKKLFIAVVLSSGFMASVAPAAVYDWSGSSNGNMSGTPANWGGIVPTGTDVARWNSATYTTAPTANLSMTIGELLFDAGNTGGVTFGAGANTLTLNGISGVGLQVNSGSGAVNTGAAKFALGAAQAWTNNSGSLLTVGGTVGLGANILTVNGSGNSTLGGVVSGTGGISKGGAGTLTLNGANNFTTGGVALSAGTLSLGNNTALGASATSVLTITGGTIDVTAARATANAQNWNGDFTFAGTNTWNTGAGVITLNANRQVTVSASTMTVAGVIGDGGSGFGLTKAGAGTLALSGANTFSGVVTIDAGILNTSTLAAVNTVSGLGKGSAGGSAADLVFGGGTLQYTTAAVATTNRLFTIGDATGLTATLDSSAVLAANTMSFTGAGALGLGGSGARTLTLTGSNTGANTLASIIGDGAGGSTSVAKLGAGAWVLSGANTYTGPTTISAGTLSVAATGNLGASGSNLVFDGGTLRVTGTTLTNISGMGRTVTTNSGKTVGLDINNVANVFTFDQVLNQGTGGLTKLGTGTLVLNQANTYSGTTNINAGIVQINASNNLGNASATNTLGFSGNGVLQVTGGTVDLTANRSITMGGGGLIQLDPTTALTVSGNITSTVTATLTFVTAATGASSVLISGTVTDGGSSVTSLNFGQFSGGSGIGTAEITGTNSYSGLTYVDFAQGSAGSLTTSGTNSSAGTTTVNGGTLILNNASNGGLASGNLNLTVGSLKALTAAAGTLSNNVVQGNSFTITGNNSITLNGDFTNGAAATRTLTNSIVSGKSLTMAGNVNLGSLTTSGSTFLLSGNGDTNITGGIRDFSGGVGTAAGNLSKTGTGKLTLSGANTYTGTTTITGGTLLVNGSLGSGNVNLSVGTTLGGNGTIGGATTITNGTLSPGNSSGVLAFGSNLTLTGNSTNSVFELASGARGTNYDGVNVGGVMNYDGTLTLSIAALLSGATYNLFDFTSDAGDFDAVVFAGGFYTGSFTNSSGIWSALAGGQNFVFSETSGDLVVSAVPEPSTYALLGLGMGALWLLRRGKKKSV